MRGAGCLKKKFLAELVVVVPGGFCVREDIVLIAVHDPMIAETSIGTVYGEHRPSR
jgi:hypothetical protein